MKIAICDDDVTFQEEAYRVLTSCENSISGAAFHRFLSGNELIAHYMKGNRFDVVFLDVEMPGLSGLETGKQIRELDGSVIIVFLTSYFDYVFQSLKIDIFDYLIKPINKIVANDLLLRLQNKYREQHFVVNLKWQSDSYSLEVHEIIYVESYGRHVVFHTKGRSYKCVGKLKDYESKLTPYGFLRCHQGCLINMRYIKSIEASRILLTTGKEIHMSFKRRPTCVKIYGEYITRYKI